MAERKTTTVEFYDYLSPIKDKLFAIHGLKDSVSAGIFLFSQLSIDDQVKLVLFIKGKSKKSVDIYEDRMRLIKIKKLIETEAETIHGGGVALNAKLLIFLKSLIGDPQKPTISDWAKMDSMIMPPSKTKVVVTHLKLDDFKKVAGPDVAAEHPVNTDNKKLGDNSKTA